MNIIEPIYFHSFITIIFATLMFTTLPISAYSPTERTFSVNHFYGRTNLVTARVDPILFPGGPASHVHVVQGGNAFAVTMTDTQALQSTCTSSLVKNDKSNYWTPALYFQDPQTGQFEAVELSYMQVYYFFEATTDIIKAFPPGLRMVSGDPNLRTPPETGSTIVTNLANGPPQPVQWTCPRSDESSPLYPLGSDGLHGVGIQDPENRRSGVGFPDKNCDSYASPLRADIHFPSCYNPAVELSSFKDNMQFPTNGNCPQGWIHVPHLFYEVYWDTPKFASRWTPGQGKQPFVLANGDPTGYSLHGDFLAGWDVQTLQQIIENCNTGTNAMDTCPGLLGGLEDPSKTCNIPNPFPEEVVSGTLLSLPGDNPVSSWGVTHDTTHDLSKPYKKKSVAKVSSLSSASLTKSTSIPITQSDLEKSWSYLGCYSKINHDIRHTAGIILINLKSDAVSNTECMAHCDAKGYSISGTQYIKTDSSQCFCSDSLGNFTAMSNELCNITCKEERVGNEQICGSSSLASNIFIKKSSRIRQQKGIPFFS